MTISFHPVALEEYQQASVWYEEDKAGLGLKFEKIIENKLKQIEHNPLAFAKVKGPYRKAIIRSFPFIIIYKFYSRKKEVYISSIYHTGRNPRGKYRK